MELFQRNKNDLHFVESGKIGNIVLRIMLWKYFWTKEMYSFFFLQFIIYNIFMTFLFPFLPSAKEDLKTLLQRAIFITRNHKSVKFH